MTEAWAVIDPNWGEPVLLITTIRETKWGAMRAAERTNERATNLYSGMTSAGPGSWEKLEQHGFRVARVVINVESDQL